MKPARVIKTVGARSISAVKTSLDVLVIGAAIND